MTDDNITPQAAATVATAHAAAVNHQESTPPPPYLAYVQCEPSGAVISWSTGEPDDFANGNWHTIPNDPEGEIVFADLKKHSPHARATAQGNTIKTITRDTTAQKAAEKAATDRIAEREYGGKVLNAENLRAIGAALEMLLVDYEERPLSADEQIIIRDFRAAMNRIKTAVADKAAKTANAVSD